MVIDEYGSNNLAEISDEDKISDEKFDKILTKIKNNNPGLTKIDFSYKFIAPGKIKILFEALQTNTYVKILNFEYARDYFSSIGEKEAILLSQMLVKNTSIERLSLFGNDIGGIGISAIVKSLEKHSTISYLDLSYTNMGVDSATAIGNMLRENSFIEHIVISSNKIGKVGATKIAEAFTKQHNKTLVKLDLPSDGNLIIDEKWKNFLDQLFIKVLAVNNNLLILDRFLIKCEELSRKRLNNAERILEDIKKQMITKKEQPSDEICTDQLYDELQSYFRLILYIIKNSEEYSVEVKNPIEVENFIHAICKEYEKKPRIVVNRPVSRLSSATEVELYSSKFDKNSEEEQKNLKIRLGT